jgi:hypothetical protein
MDGRPHQHAHDAHTASPPEVADRWRSVCISPGVHAREFGFLWLETPASAVTDLAVCGTDISGGHVTPRQKRSSSALFQVSKCSPTATASSP